MKKRWLFSLLTLCALALCLSSCLKDGATGELKDEPKDETVDHRSLSCTEYDDFLPYRFGEEDGAYALSLHLPADWEAVPDEEGIGYFMNGRQVARVQADDAPDEDYVCVEKTLLGDEGMDIDVCVERKGTGASAVYRRVVRIWLLAEDTSQVFSLTADYTALSDEGVAQVIAAPSLCTAAAHGLLGLAAQEQERGLNVLILGNSFISTSKVGQILDDMCIADGRRVTVRAISRGYAHVQTFVNDTTLMAEIARGDYDLVLQCGFYAVEEISYFARMYDACAASDTALMIFPAHNEPAAILERVKATYPDVIYLDWKSTVQSFLDAGGAFLDFCWDDSHRHSTSLAGYVGAHLIYRAVFGEAPHTVPTFQLNGSMVGEAFVTETLGEDFVTANVYPLWQDTIFLP